MASKIQARFKLDFVGVDTDAGFSLDLDVSIPGQGITVVFGASGSGKTTFLRCLAGLTRPDSGHLQVDADVWQDSEQFLPPHKRPIGYVFQESSLFPHLDVLGNLQYACKRAESASAEGFRHVVTSMGLENLQRRYPRQLSGGERQRVAIARALLIQPRVLLMDEPLASLDNARKREILPYLERLHAEIAIPIVYVSHSVDEVLRLADHLLVLDQGRRVTQGTPAEVFAHPGMPAITGEEPGVIIDGRIGARDEPWHLLRVDFAGGSLWIPDNGDALHQPVRVHILARDVSLAVSDNYNSSIINRLSVKVNNIVEAEDRATALVYLAIGSGSLVARVTRKSIDQLQLRPGQGVWAQIKSAALIR